MNLMFWTISTNITGTTLQAIDGNLFFFGIGIIAIIVAVVVFFFLKNIIINSILGIIAWAILYFVFKIKIGFLLSLVVSAIFGLAGIGVLLVLKFFGVPI